MLDLVIFAPVCVDVDDNDGDAGSGKLDYAKNVLLPDRMLVSLPLDEQDTRIVVQETHSSFFHFSSASFFTQTRKI